ncbi:MAG: nucleotidyltransferase [Planctomycetota bacterium]|jgi:hypothetical protein
MGVNPDFKDLFAAFNAAEVRYLVVGAYAVTFHARPRFTKDLDVWVDPDPGNAARVFEALSAFGAPMGEVSESDFSAPDMVFQIGVAPNRIDIVMAIEGVAFPDAWERRVETRYGDCPMHVISREDLIVNKRILGRPRDREDLRALEGDAEA